MISVNFLESKHLYWPLIPGSFLYCIAVSIRNRLYDMGKLPLHRLQTKVISVGNITVGGTGKTPTVEYVASGLKKLSAKVCVLSRGYRRKSKGPIIVSDEVKLLVDLEQAGDEPFLLAKRLEGIPVVVDSDRYRGGLLAEKHFSPDYIILDDGFQHRRLARDLDIVLLDATRPFGNGWLLPVGPLREKAQSLRRASMILLTHADNDETIHTAKSEISKYSIAPVWSSMHKPRSLLGVTGSDEDPYLVQGKKIIAFCGIANPQGFKKTLLRLGAHIVDFLPFNDHHFYTSNDLKNVIKNALTNNVELIVTTEKDWNKLPRPLQSEVPVKYLTIELFVQKSDTFFHAIKGV